MKHRSIMAYLKISTALVAGLFLFAACAGRVPPTKVPSGLPPSQRPYKVSGVWYYPIPSALGYTEEGIASWYGDDFHGKPTSSGEKYDMYAMTAAHKVLPLGTHVKVTNLQNSSNIIVRVNDRGPFVAGRVIDLTYSGAHKLGMVEPGTIPVRVEAVQVATQQQVDGKTVWAAEPVGNFRFGNFAIQVGAFQKVANALKLRGSMLEEYTKVHIHPPSYYDKDGYYRVQVGAFKDLLKAQAEVEKLKKKGFPDSFVVAVEE